MNLLFFWSVTVCLKSSDWKCWFNVLVEGNERTEVRKNLGESSKNVSYSKMAENSWSGQQATEEIVV